MASVVLLRHSQLGEFQLFSGNYIVYFSGDILAPTPLAVTWHFSFQNTSFQLALEQKNVIFLSPKKQFKKGKKCHETFWLTPSLHLVLFGDNVATSSPKVSRIFWIAP